MGIDRSTGEVQARPPLRLVDTMGQYFTLGNMDDLVTL